MSEPAATPAGGSKSERAYQMIKDRITDGTYSPGYRLVLDQLAGELSVSPVPVREAIRRLEAEGYVEFERNVGAQVASIDAAQYASTMEVLALLEGAATAAAAPRLNEDDLDHARQINERMRGSLAEFDPLGFTRLNHEFHEVLCARCPNPHLRGLVEREWSRLNVIRRTTFSLVPGRAANSVEEHDQILKLIAAGASATEIERVAREHKLGTLRALHERTDAGPTEVGRKEG